MRIMYYNFVIIVFVMKLFGILGKFVFVVCENKGYGGVIRFNFKCCGCWSIEVDYKSSEFV